MKLYYITAMIWDKPMALCISYDLEYVGYNGAQINHELSFCGLNDIGSAVYGKIAFFTAEEIEAVMMIKNGCTEKRTILDCRTHQWAYVLKDVNIQVKEVSLSI